MKYRKKPVVIEAMRLTDNWREVCDWVNANAERVDPMRPKAYMPSGPDADILIVTLEGDMRAVPGDWIIRGVQGEFYPCKPDIFEATYEAVSDDAPNPEPLPTEPGYYVSDAEGFQGNLYEYRHGGWCSPDGYPFTDAMMRYRVPLVHLVREDGK